MRQRPLALPAFAAVGIAGARCGPGPPLPDVSTVIPVDMLRPERMPVYGCERIEPLRTPGHAG